MGFNSAFKGLKQLDTKDISVNVKHEWTYPFYETMNRGQMSNYRSRTCKACVDTETTLWCGYACRSLVL